MPEYKINFTLFDSLELFVYSTLKMQLQQSILIRSFDVETKVECKTKFTQFKFVHLLYTTDLYTFDSSSLFVNSNTIKKNLDDYSSSLISKRDSTMLIYTF